MAPGNGASGSHLAQAAARRLGLEPDSAPEAARGRILRQVRDHGFLLDPDRHQAIMFLYGQPVGYSSFLAEEDAAEEERLCGRVEVFAGQFFDLRVDERLARWQSLVQECAAHASLLDWLRAVEPGLQVDRKSFSRADPAVVRLANDILTLWALRPAARAPLSRELAARFRSDPNLSNRERAGARWRLKRLHPDVAALARGYFEQILPPSRAVKKARGRAGRVNRRFDLTGVIVGCVVGVIALMLRAGSKQEVRQPVRPVQAPAVRQTGNASPMPAASQSIPAWRGPYRPPVRFAVDPPPLGQALSPELVQFFREQFKTALIRELAKFGKTLDESKLQIVVECLPEDLAGIQRHSPFWSTREYDRIVSALEGGLARMGLALSPVQLKEVAQESVPKAFLGPPDFRPVLSPSGQPAIPL